jgi:tetratricopeptide (TPR) repeat protein
MTFPLTVLGEREEAMEAGRHALAIAEDLQDLPLRTESHFYVSLIHFNRGEYRQAIELHRWNVQVLQGDLIRFGTPGVTSVQSRAWLAWCHAELGEFPEALAAAADGVQIAEEIGQVYSRIAAYWGAAVVHLHKGELQEAIGWLEPALTLCRTSDIEAWRQWIISSLGWAHALAGRAREALPLARDAFDQLGGMTGLRGPAAVWLGEIYLLAGVSGEAHQIALKAVEVFRAGRERGREAEASRLLGAIALTSHPPDLGTAEARYRDALLLAMELEMRPLVARCHLGLGQVYERAGEQDRAREHLNTAATMFREMGMQFWLDRATGEAGELA